MDKNDVLEVRNPEDLDRLFKEAEAVVLKKYMSDIGRYEIKEADERITGLDVNGVVRLNKIDRLVYDTEENNLDKLMNVYNAVALCGGSVINVILSDGDQVDYYIGIRAEDINKVEMCQKTFKGTFEGNFPGSELTKQKKSALYNCVGRIFPEDGECGRSINVVCGIPGKRNEQVRKNSEYVQGMEKLIDSLQGKKFALVIISDPLKSEKMQKIRDGYENLYSQLSVFASTSMSYSESDSNAVADTLTRGITKTFGTNISNTISNSLGTSQGITKTKGQGVGVGVHIPIKKIVAGVNFQRNLSQSESTTISKSESRSTGMTSSNSVSDSESEGKTETYTNTAGRTLQINMENKKIKTLLEKINAQLKRIENAADLGLWNTAAYCIGEDTQTGMMLANAFESICRGEKSTIESFSVGTWSGKNSVNKAEAYLRKFCHPVLELELETGTVDFTPSSLINGEELVIEAGLPQKSVAGIPVSEMVPFSRNVISESEGNGTCIHLGNIYHMGHRENGEINLDIESLSSHTLVTGSTGSGKSNTVYQMLNGLLDNHITFLVIEPAKGEYKNVFGNREDVHVFGTNARLAELLRINPFAFPESIHILEHIDRLIEIFNVCWPMYAAMPAVLKDAVLQAYESCGWDLEESVNCYTPVIYPTFKDLLKELTVVISRSAYSDEVKGNYIGSLATRIRSLTNGLNGRIFTDHAIPDAELFDRNVIIDLSRVGSSETKSLIMGLLVIKLNEYRMDQAEGLMNQKLKHITVLEEAHNLLKNASVSANSEDGGNLAGKSVEMIANSIAEMRTYGEGFIIVDQSPGAIDISAIRNTNTKIIMRLPEQSDREQAGKAAALSDKQINEIAKLHRGIAVVYQNDWLDPVLCRICKADVTEEKYQYIPDTESSKLDVTPLLELLMQHRISRRIDENIDDVEKIAEAVRISSGSKILLRRCLDKLRRKIEPELLDNSSFPVLSDVVVEIIGCSDNIEKFIQFGENCELIQQELNREIERCAWTASSELKLAVSQCIMHELVEKDHQQIELYQKWREYAVNQRKVM